MLLYQPGPLYIGATCPQNLFKAVANPPSTRRTSCSISHSQAPALKSLETAFSVYNISNIGEGVASLAYLLSGSYKVVFTKRRPRNSPWQTQNREICARLSLRVAELFAEVLRVISSLEFSFQECLHARRRTVAVAEACSRCWLVSWRVPR